MDTAKRLKKLVKKLGWPQYKLPQELGQAPSTGANYFGGRTPEPLVCLYLAGLSEPEERDFWVEASTLTEKQLGLVRKGLRIDPPSTGELKEIMDLLYHQCDAREEAVVKAIRDLAKNRIGGEQ